MIDVRAYVGVTANEPLPTFAWPGGYPIVYLAEDGAGFCADCANQADAEPEITAADVFYEGPSTFCDGCGREIESAYGDPDAPEGEES